MSAKIGILGSGSMGSGIAQVAAMAQHDVVVYDNNPKAGERAQQQLQQLMKKLVAKGKYSQAKADGILRRIRFVDDRYDLGDSEVVIEAIIEDLEVKKSVFEQLEDIVEPHSLLATNTSSLSIAAIAAACRHPERVVGMHFFNPAALMQLVEIIPAVQTDPATVLKAKKLAKSWGKSPVEAKDTPGFIVNRIARPFYGEALRILEEGIATTATIDWAMTELGGFRMGPFMLMDYIGNDVNYKVTETVFESFFYEPRYKPSFTQKRLAEAGYLGRKSGRGFYNYGEDAENPTPNEDQELGKQILHRILVMLINEAADALYFNIASKADIEMGMTKGVNYPKGLLYWADELGINWCVERLDALHQEYLEDRYRCSPILRRLARNGRQFFSY